MAGRKHPRTGRSPSRRIDLPGPRTDDWRERTLSRLRESIQRATPDAVEEVKWKRPGNPDGVPVWSHHGMICIANTLKSAVRLTFPKGAQIRDPQRLFNARIESRTVRAIDVHEGESVDEAALEALVVEAVRLNASPLRERDRRAGGD